MTNVELIEAIRDDFIKEFDDNLSKEDTTNAFRNGVVFAYNYLLTVLEKHDEWIYEKKGDR